MSQRDEHPQTMTHSMTKERQRACPLSRASCRQHSRTRSSELLSPCAAVVSAKTRSEVYFSVFFALLCVIVGYNELGNVHLRTFEALIFVFQKLKFLTVFLTVSKSVKKYSFLESILYVARIQWSGSRGNGDNSMASAAIFAVVQLVDRPSPTSAPLELSLSDSQP
jgi:hypothetical protein